MDDLSMMPNDSPNPYLPTGGDALTTSTEAKTVLDFVRSI